MTPGTGLLNREEALLNSDLPPAGARPARRRRGAGGRAGPGAGFASGFAGKANPRRGARNRLLEPEVQLVAKIRAAVDALSAAATTEDVAEHLVEDIPESGTTGESAAARVHSGVTELIVGGPLPSIGKDVVGLLRLLEPLLRSGIVGIPIGMQLHRQAAIRVLELGVPRITGHTQYVVVVPFRHALPSPAVCRSRPGEPEHLQRRSSRTSSNSASTTSSVPAGPVPASPPSPPPGGPSSPAAPCVFR